MTMTSIHLMKIKGENGGGEIKDNDGESKDESENREMMKKKKVNQTVGRRSADLLLISSDAFHLE